MIGSLHKHVVLAVLLQVKDPGALSRIITYGITQYCGVCAVILSAKYTLQFVSSAYIEYVSFFLLKIVFMLMILMSL